jgi:manganese-transporting P-type ATPase
MDKKFKSKTIESISFHNYKPIYFHWNILPFIFIYVFNLILFFNLNEFTIFFISFGIQVLIQLFLSLMCLWNLKFRILIQYTQTTKVQDATFVFVQPKEHKGQQEICLLSKEEEFIEFEYQKRKYQFKENIFQKIQFPIKKKINFYKNQKGIQSEQEELKMKKEYGSNKLLIPIPKLMDLVKEQAIQPFFIFQVFCVILFLFLF